MKKVKVNPADALLKLASSMEKLADSIEQSAATQEKIASAKPRDDSYGYGTIGTVVGGTSAEEQFTSFCLGG